MAWNDEVVTPQGSAVPSQTVCLAGNATLSVTADGVEIKNDEGNPVPVSGTVTASVGDGGSPASLASGKIAWTPGESYPVLNAVRLGFAGEEAYSGVGLDSGGAPLPVKLYTSSDSASEIDSGNPLPISGTVTADGGDFAKIPAIETSPPSKAIRIGFGTDENWNGVGLGGSGLPLPVAIFDAAGTSDGIGFTNIAGDSYANVNVGNTVTVSDRGATGEATVSSFTSTTSATLEASNSNRKLLTIFNEGAGNLHILYGAGTASTTNYSVRLSAGGYLEIEKYTGQVNAIFATAGTARVTEIT